MIVAFKILQETSSEILAPIFEEVAGRFQILFRIGVRRKNWSNATANGVYADLLKRFFVNILKSTFGEILWVRKN